MYPEAVVGDVEAGAEGGQEAARERHGPLVPGADASHLLGGGRSVPEEQ